MKIAAISFTVKGANLLERLTEHFEQQGDRITSFTTKDLQLSKVAKTQSRLGDWTREHFYTTDALIFVGACGIAVRAIAPYLKHKTVDPCIISVDENAEFIIPILSGHIGGGNELALRIENITGGKAVISTATDLNHKFAVDVFAKKNNFYISDLQLAKKISSLILDNEKIGLINDFLDDVIIDKNNIDGQGQLVKEQVQDYNIHITVKKESMENTLKLIPKVIYLGVGCRKNVPSEKLEQFILTTLEEENIDINSVYGIYSVALKAKEPCILDFAAKYKLDFQTYSAEELMNITGVFSTSDFVRKITGVDSVCERCAVKASGNGPLVFKKKAYDGMTLAISIKSGI